MRSSRGSEDLNKSPVFWVNGPPGWRPWRTCRPRTTLHSKYQSRRLGPVLSRSSHHLLSIHRGDALQRLLVDGSKREAHVLGTCRVEKIPEARKLFSDIADRAIIRVSYSVALYLQWVIANGQLERDICHRGCRQYCEIQIRWQKLWLCLYFVYVEVTLLLSSNEAGREVRSDRTGPW